MNKKTDSKYTDLWTDNFTEKDVVLFDNKFHNRFEKNIMHFETLNLLKNYINKSFKWCDAPIGSGRFMKDFQTTQMYGYDISKSFYNYNKQRGIHMKLGDINDFPFKKEFDVITCFNMLFAFSNQLEIVKKLSVGLKKNGSLIFDLVNFDHTQKYPDNSKFYANPKVFESSYVKKELNKFNLKIVEIHYANYWDNRKFHKLWKKYPL